MQVFFCCDEQLSSTIVSAVGLVSALCLNPATRTFDFGRRWDSNSWSVCSRRNSSDPAAHAKHYLDEKLFIPNVSTIF